MAALEVVILTTSSAASDENFIKMKTFPFQCDYISDTLCSLQGRHMSAMPSQMTDNSTVFVKHDVDKRGDIVFSLSFKLAIVD